MPKSDAVGGGRECRHKFVFVRQESEKRGGWHPESDFYDVFHCEKCLLYRRVKVAETATYGDGRTERRSTI